MYSILLASHSLVRWLVLICLVFAIIRACQGLIFKKIFTRFDNSVRHWTVTASHIQLVIGLCLYYISPFVDYFLDNFKEAVHQREFRFFGMEHSLMMTTAIVFITIGSAKAKRKKTDTEKFKTMLVWFIIALVIIFTSIPWEFSPFTRRPYFRPF